MDPGHACPPEQPAGSNTEGSHTNARCATSVYVPFLLARLAVFATFELGAVDKVRIQSARV
jgi:hypothetical protein